MDTLGTLIISAYVMGMGARTKRMTVETIREINFQDAKVLTAQHKGDLETYSCHAQFPYCYVWTPHSVSL